MSVHWTAHRFSGGALALDTANTVVLRGRPEEFDRFADVEEIARFAEAASHYRSDELGGRRLAVADPAPIASTVIDIREATDALFRRRAASVDDRAALPRFLRACAAGLDGAVGDPRGPWAFEAALATSALSLLAGDARRLRVCRNCNWLFIDRSRNSSRLWCDMAVCGNRQKARRHYRRRKPATEDRYNA